ncbi:replication-relaxation family protein [Streptomyces sp. LX-29]|uniref:replication-relaxation family protein n=1 Tax=Streptomyces sp. LX-29 TaxID=2900152 RepID=UPI00240D284F|nr:replication-relaxation family protein [Streptomyces sp. LX-29]WFB11968.1 replication-relaxation family protein [Streptomyces sp. LX-29]
MPKPPPRANSRRRPAGPSGKRIAASKTGLREHGLALVDTVIAFHQAQVADHADWQLEVPHPTPAGNLVPDSAVLLADGSSAFVEIDRTKSYARLIAKLERYDAYRNAPASGRGNAARPPTLPLEGDLRRAVPGPAVSRRCCSSSPRPRAARPRQRGRPPSTTAPTVRRT